MSATTPRLLVLFTDFGAGDLYVPQVKLALAAEGIALARIVDLLHDAPAFDVKASAHLLAALFERVPREAALMAVVDPGVGSDRGAAVLRADDRWLVGPDNGLLCVVAARASRCEYWNIHWRPPTLAPSFHGRDLFAPIAAALARGEFPRDRLARVERLDVELSALDLHEVIYIDHYGNAFTGIRAASIASAARLRIADRIIAHANVFSAVPHGEVFWYQNSSGLVEIAANGAAAAQALSLRVGTPIKIS
jgi:S-adenosyl-L-methionine hydrolase (adenosine-forming)